MAKLVTVRAIECPTNVLTVDESSAAQLLGRGTWELVPDEQVKEEEVTKDDGSKPARRRRTPRPPAAS
jgi:hypothetical protein